MTYKIVRHFFNETWPNKTIQKGLTLEEAQAWCNNPETSSNTCTNPEGMKRTELFGAWYDGFYREN